MSNLVNTVTGPVSAESLGKTLIHEHFIFGFPGYSGDVTLGGIDYEANLKEGVRIAEKIKSHGIQTVVDPTPNECGRDPEFLKSISESTGLQIICATGYYFEGGGAPSYFNARSAFSNIEEEIYEMFMKEIYNGIGKTGIKPGVIKLASSNGIITPYEQAFFKASAKAHNETGITIITHTENGTMGPEQAELLISNGVNPKKIIIGHMCGNTDVSYQLRTLDKGVNVAFDRFGTEMSGFSKDREREALLIRLIGMGYLDQLMISQDAVGIWLGRPRIMDEETQKMWETFHSTHIFEVTIPHLEKSGVSKSQINTLIRDNPKRAFSK